RPKGATCGPIVGSRRTSRREVPPEPEHGAGATAFHAPTDTPVRSRFTSGFGLLLRPAADVEVVHPHVHRLGDRIADPAPNRHPADLRPAPCFGLGARAIEHVPVLAHLYAVDPPVRLTVRQVARVRDQHHLPTMPLTARQRDGG